MCHGAVAQTVGAIGLIQSAAKDQNMNLSAGEVYQLIQTVTDVNLTEDREVLPKPIRAMKDGMPLWIRTTSCRTSSRAGCQSRYSSVHICQ